MPRAMFAKSYQYQTCGTKHPVKLESQEIYGGQSQECQLLDDWARLADLPTSALHLKISCQKKRYV